MGYNLLSGSITQGKHAAIQITASFAGDGSGLLSIPHTSVYTITNSDADRIITANSSDGNSFTAEENFTFSSAQQVLTVKGISGNAATVSITGSTSSPLFHIKSNVQQNVLYVSGSGRIGIGTALPQSTLSVSGSTHISASSAPLHLFGVQTELLPNTSSYLALNSSGQVVLTSSAQGVGSVTEAFKTISVSGQDDVVADTGTDTLTLVAGSNITITTNAGGDTITFASSGGGGGGSGIFTEVDGSKAYVTSSLTIGSSSAPTHEITVIGDSHLSGGVVHMRRHVTADYSLVTGDYYIGVDTTSAVVRLTLPMAANTTSGQTFVIKDEGGQSGANNITVHRNSGGSDTVDGGESLILESPYAAVSLYSNGTNGYFVY